MPHPHFPKPTDPLELAGMDPGQLVPDSAVFRSGGKAPVYSSRTIEFLPLGGAPGLSGTQALLTGLLDASIILPEEWEETPSPVRKEVVQSADVEALIRRLVEHRLLTTYQAARIKHGRAADLRIGQYRILEKLGAGGMGVVYHGEHLYLRRQVAIKILSLEPGRQMRAVDRFHAEARAVARLRHPNIVACFDAGEHVSADQHAPVLHYYIMEFVPGEDLETLVRTRGPLPLQQATAIVKQCAEALAEAHRFGLIHRDIKPSNILVAPDGQAKLLDFGLARQPLNRMTIPGTMLGTVGYMAPEQAWDASQVDARADVYGLGGTLYWCLTGEPPFPESDNPLQDITSRVAKPIPSLKGVRSDLPEELDAVLARMLASKPADRLQSASAVALALFPFTGEMGGGMIPRSSSEIPSLSAMAREYRALLVDDEPHCRQLYRAILENDGIACSEADGGKPALALLQQTPHDLIILDLMMPGLDGAEFLKRMRGGLIAPLPEVIVVSGLHSPDELGATLQIGADDFLVKPFHAAQLRCRARAALRRKATRDRLDSAIGRLSAENDEAQRNARSLAARLSDANATLIQTLAGLLEASGIETPGHLERVQRYIRCLAEAARPLPELAGQIDDEFLAQVESAAPLYDLGKLILSHQIVLKPGRLDADERQVMQAHTTVGAETLQAVAERFGHSLPFLKLAIDIARHHHERFDGNGYPEGLSGSAIPLAARMVAIVDVYNALRSRRPYRPAFPHGKAVRAICEESAGQFDPALLAAFAHCAPEFERICQKYS